MSKELEEVLRAEQNPPENVDWGKEFSSVGQILQDLLPETVKAEKEKKKYRDSPYAHRKKD